MALDIYVALAPRNLIRARQRGLELVHEPREEVVSELLHNLFRLLNADLSINVSPVDEPTKEGASTASAKKPQAPAADGDSDDNKVRELTLRSYQEKPLERNASHIFHLRYAAYGDYSSMIAAHGYAWRPGKLRPPEGSPNALGLAIEFNKEPIASITVVFDSEILLAADDTFPDEMSHLRVRHGRMLLELTNFILSKEHKSRRVVAGLFHILYLYGKQARQIETAVLQTHIHHVKFYETMFGFQKIAERDKKALMYIDFEYMKRQIRAFGGHPMPDQSNGNGLYPFFFPAKDEPGLLYRLLEHLGVGAPESR